MLYLSPLWNKTPTCALFEGNIQHLGGAMRQSGFVSSDSAHPAVFYFPYTTAIERQTAQHTVIILGDVYGGALAHTRSCAPGQRLRVREN